MVNKMNLKKTIVKSVLISDIVLTKFDLAHGHLFMSDSVN